MIRILFITCLIVLWLTACCSADETLFVHAMNNKLEMHGYVHNSPDMDTASFSTVDAELLVGSASWSDGVLNVSGHGCFLPIPEASSHCSEGSDNIFPMSLQIQPGGTSVWLIDGGYFRGFSGTQIESVANVPEAAGLGSWLVATGCFVGMASWLRRRQ